MSKKLENLKLFISESMGVDPTHITTFETFGSGVLLQFHEDVRGGFVVDHEDNEYVYLSTHYGFREIYDFIKADSLNEALDKMIKLSIKLDIEQGA